MLKKIILVMAIFATRSFAADWLELQGVNFTARVPVILSCCVAA